MTKIFIKKHQALELLLREYPALSKYNFKLIKRFVSPGGRKYNTFLAKSNNQNLKKIIFKSRKYTTQNLIKEWQFHKYLQKRNITFIPKLLFPNQKPKKFLVMNFIEGNNANFSDIKKVAHTTAKLHSININKNNSQIPVEQNWGKSIQNKFLERLEGIKKIIGNSYYQKSINIFQETTPFIKIDSLKRLTLIHRDIYLENFIIQNNKAVLIDFGMSQTGRPFYDLGKLVMLNLSEKPNLTPVFLKSYKKNAPYPKNSKSIIIFYTLFELLGTVNFANHLNNQKYLKSTLLLLHDLLNKKGNITKVINYF